MTTTTTTAAAAAAAATTTTTTTTATSTTTATTTILLARLPARTRALGGLPAQSKADKEYVVEPPESFQARLAASDPSTAATQLKAMRAEATKQARAFEATSRKDVDRRKREQATALAALMKKQQQQQLLLQAAKGK